MHRLKDLYPAWFPYPSSWLKALGLSLWLAIGIRVILFWSAVTGLVLSELAEDPEPLVWSLLVGSALSTLAFIFLHYLFNRPKPPHPQWLPSGENIGSGLFADLVMFLATAAAIPFIHFDSYYYLDWTWEEYEAYLTMLGAIWLVTAAYCYQIRYLLRQHFPKANRPPKPKEPAKKHTADRSDADLGRLRGELGLTRMGKKPVVMVPLNTPAPKPQPKQRMMVLILLFLLGVTGSVVYAYRSNLVAIFSSETISEQPQSSTIAPLPAEPPTDTPWNQAVREAMSAAELTQTARTPENWTLVTDKWQRAIALLQSIPPSDPTYPQAQQKITEYGNNLAYAQQALNNLGKP